ncbi:L-lactate dehydrogenase (quinone) large subunit LdhH [Desulfatitalea alkaliphila]|uniref:LUD domain-containing protein n=1 Tax=Desulfatitalea alkaliphila TaxID=2929485 RepID=A0AA41R1P0_9BACT|nr:LUD domain-containing protein [Desulfatitalea alkaliphila]MCJ8500118.1 LUD domain-containing protein [Desulfatitalea alkaliphila]
MQTAENNRQYRKQLKEALDNAFQRKALDNFAVAYRGIRVSNFEGIDRARLIERIGKAKDAAMARVDALYHQFREKAEAAGATVHLAASDAAANEIIARIAAENSCTRIVKSKSMTAEETLLNHFLENRGYEVIETDLGEWIIQLRREGPSHMVMPAIHLSRNEVSRLFTEVTGKPQDTDIEKLVKVARRELRERFVTADMGISGANFAIAETGTLGIVSNEGNVGLVTTMPRVHVALVGIDKLTATVADALTVLTGLPRNATGQAITSYVTWITGANPSGASATGRKNMHIVFLDNGRSALAGDPVFSQALRCVRCGACANVCPIYRLVGGHAYGHIYIGAIGLILTYFFHGRDKDKHLIENCLNCQACKEVCVAGIDLPRLIREVQKVVVHSAEQPFLPGLMAAYVLKRRRVFHALLRSGRYVQQPVTGNTSYARHLPDLLFKDHKFKELPALAKKPFRDQWQPAAYRPARPRYKVALFSGCLQDFVYPEQLLAGTEMLKGSRVRLDFIQAQGCCGLPLYMLGEHGAAADLARWNMANIDPGEYDFVLTLCASCASHMKENYPFLLEKQAGTRVNARQYADKVIDYSSFMLLVGESAAAGKNARGQKAAYHAPCHLCRGLGVSAAPRELLEIAGYAYVPHDEEETCCGLGGSYSFKFPEVSAAILDKKLGAVAETGAEILVTDCPGCVMQLRGGALKQGRPIKVLHMAEALQQSK